MTNFSNKEMYRSLLLGGSLCLSLGALAQPLAGSYTIDGAQATAGTNFASFNAAVNALSTNGISSAVTFQVAAGTYNEQVIIPQISGASATQTITFAGPEAVLSYHATNSAARAVLKLDGADHIILDGLTIQATATGGSGYGFGVQLTNDADNNRIHHCTIGVFQNATGAQSNDFAGVVINSAADVLVTTGNSNCDHNLIEDNTISGGYHAVVMAGNTADGLISGNVVRNNIITEFFNTGVYLRGNNAAVVKGNDISRPARTTAGQFYGIQLNELNTGVQVSGNAIHDPFGGTTAYVNSGFIGIYLVNVNATAESRNEVSNNIIYNIRSGSVIRGIWISGSSYARAQHNTISFDDADYTGFGGSTGFDIGTSSYLTLQNNIVSMRRTGATGASRAGIYVAGTTTGTVVGGNCVYTPPPATSTFFGRWGNTNCADVTAWSAATGDNTSIAENPQFTATSSGNLLPTNFNTQSGIPVSATGVTTDIDGMGRNSIPTMGAFELDGIVLPVQLSQLTARLDNDRALLSWSTYTEQHNAGFRIQRSSDARSWEDAGFVASKAPGGNSSFTLAYRFTDPGIQGRAYYRLQQEDHDGHTTYSNVVMLEGTGSAPGLSLTPNPASAFVTLTFKGIPGTADIYVMDQAGRLVYQATTTDSFVSIPVKTLPAGSYYVRVAGSGATLHSRFIKK